jgi:hypothetical protein
VQINFGVILNESLADSVKVTVIATGFQPENARAQPAAPERRANITPVVRAQPSLPLPEPEPVVQPEPMFEPEPEAEPALMAEVDPSLELDMDDLDTPAYLRQGRLLN